MARVVVTERADADSAAIFDDLEAKAGTDVADRYDAKFDKLYRRLAMFPLSGVPRPKLGRYVRVAVVSPYMMIYRYNEVDLILIVRIVHGSRRITRKLLSNP